MKVFVRRRRNEMGLSQAAFAKIAGVEAHTIWQIEKGATKSPKSDTVQGLARALAIPPEQVVLMLRDDSPKSDTAFDPNSAANFLKARGETPPENSEHANIQHAPRVIPSIPEWTAEIACGHWIDCSTAALDPDTQMAIIRAGRFRVRVMGDSMLPKYKPGACVQFRIVRMDEEALQIGAHYYVQNSDGQCTLKVLKAIEEDEYVLAPTNRKYKPLRIAKQMVARWAIVETIVVAPWEE